VRTKNRNDLRGLLGRAT